MNASGEERGAAQATTVGAPRICIVTAEFAGPDYNGGIGTATRGLALYLANSGCDVDVLYTRVDHGEPFSRRGDFAASVADMNARNVRLMCIPHGGEWSDWAAKAYEVMLHLVSRRYDIVFFNDTHGSGFYAMLAKRAGNPALRATTLCVVAHSATQWIANANETPLMGIHDLKLLEMERRGIELCDVLIAPSRYILDAYRGFGWKLPEAVHVIRNIVGEKEPPVPPVRRTAVDELVFFGRLESRKGLWMFCRALDALPVSRKRLTVTFLGRPTFEGGVSTAQKLVAHTASWPFEVRLLSHSDSDQAIAYLRKPGRLAVMPSRIDNSPSVILECMHHGIPFIATRGSGGQEMIAPDSRAAVLCEPNAAALASKLGACLREGAVTARPADRTGSARAAYADLVADLVGKGRSVAEAGGDPGNDASWLIVAIAGPTDSPEAVATNVGLALEDAGAGARAMVFVAKPEEIQDAAGDSLPDTVSLYAYDEFAAVCRKASREGDQLLCAYRLGHRIGAPFFARAASALDAGLAAVTGLTVADEVPVRPREMRPYVSDIPTDRIPADYVIGNAEALDLYGVPSNGGFIALRARHSATLAEHSPYDRVYDRPMPPQAWLHRVVEALRDAGHRFEVLPEPLAGLLPACGGMEVMGLHDSIDDAVARLGHPRGSERALLARFAAEIGIARSRGDAAESSVGRLSRRLGVARSSWQQGEEFPRQLALAASAVGQHDLAAELLTRNAFPDALDRYPHDEDLGTIVERAARAIELLPMLADGAAVKHVNAGHAWSTEVAEDAFFLHANPMDEGRASLCFPGLPLEAVDLFSAHLMLPSGAGPVTCRLEVVATDRSAAHAAEINVDPDREVHFTAALPETLRRHCDVWVSVAMQVPLASTEHANVRWRSAEFRATA